MTEEEIIEWATERGWRVDRYGHLQKQVKSKKYRLKLGKRAVRYEVQVSVPRYEGRRVNRWVRLYSAYYGKLSVNVDGKIVGMTR